MPGDTQTSSYNLLASVVYDPKKKNVLRFEALYLRTEQEGLAAVDRTFAKARDEYTLNNRLFAFGELGYLRDNPKEVEYLISPVAGLGIGWWIAWPPPWPGASSSSSPLPTTTNAAAARPEEERHLVHRVRGVQAVDQVQRFESGRCDNRTS